MSTNILIKANLDYCTATKIKNYYRVLLDNFAEVYISGEVGKLEVRYRPYHLMELDSLEMEVR